jgi:hypothetical protein
VDNHNIERLILDLKESLERDNHTLRQELTQTVNRGLADLRAVVDTQTARLDRHAGLWQAGTRWSSRMDAWAEKVDGSLHAKDKEIADLRERITRLERKSDQ